MPSRNAAHDGSETADPHQALPVTRGATTPQYCAAPLTWIRGRGWPEHRTALPYQFARKQSSSRVVTRAAPVPPLSLARRNASTPPATTGE